jgi:hypothetical protein
MSFLYARSARFDDHGHALSEDEMRKLAPSIFATTAHESRSDRFKPVPSIEVIRGLQQEGFQPVAVQQCNTRDASKRNFTKHMIRLRYMGGNTRNLQVGDNIFEAGIVNGNDGSAAYSIFGGLFRIRCLNSLVAAVGGTFNAKVRHSGDIVAKVIEATQAATADAELALAAPQDWGAIALNRDERMAFAEGARLIRWGDAEGNVETPIQAAQLLIPRRQDDTGSDLWTTFNVCEENAIRGELSAIGRDANGRRRRFTSREVKGIDQNVNVNRALWTLAAKMAELKGAAPVAA